MSYNEPEKYFNLAGFMSGKEVDKIFDILENALDRKGWHISKDAELSVRIDCTIIKILFKYLSSMKKVSKTFLT